MLDKVNDDDDDDDSDDDDDDDVDNDYLDWVFSHLYYHDPISPVNVLEFVREIRVLVWTI